MHKILHEVHTLLHNTGGGRNPAPPGMYKTMQNPVNNGIFIHINSMFFQVHKLQEGFRLTDLTKGLSNWATEPTSKV